MVITVWWPSPGTIVEGSTVSQPSSGVGEEEEFSGADDEVEGSMGAQDGVEGGAGVAVARADELTAVVDALVKLLASLFGSHAPTETAATNNPRTNRVGLGTLIRPDTNEY